jgi:ribonuclease D
VAWVNSNEDLAALCKQWSSAEILAVDTEFFRERTFYPIPALVQVNDGKGIWLLDPLTITDWQPFATILQNPQLPKLMHSLSEDIEVFLRLTGVAPESVLDTQIGAGLAGFGGGLGYQRLVEATLNLHVDKDQTRSDWLQRPLTENQQRYAAADVRYLPAIYQVLMQKLVAQKRVRWWQHDSYGHSSVSANPVKPENYYRRIGIASRLRPQQLAVLQALCAWREVLVRELDIPRGHLFKDAVCAEIAKRLPRDMTTLATVGGIAPKILRQYGDEILGLIAQAATKKTDQCPERVVSNNPAEKNRLQAMRVVVQRIAEDLGMPDDLLLRRRDYDAILQKGSVSVISDWRRELLADELIQVLNTVSLDDVVDDDIDAL